MQCSYKTRHEFRPYALWLMAIVQVSHTKFILYCMSRMVSWLSNVNSSFKCSKTHIYRCCRTVFSTTIQIWLWFLWVHGNAVIHWSQYTPSCSKPPDNEMALAGHCQTTKHQAKKKAWLLSASLSLLTNMKINNHPACDTGPSRVFRESFGIPGQGGASSA